LREEVQAIFPNYKLSFRAASAWLFRMELEMNHVLKFYRSTLGKKFVVGVTGLAMFLFLVGHMLGNLKAFMGADAAGEYKIDIYARFLREMGEHMFGQTTLLWVARLGLLAAFVLHVVTIIQLQILNRKSRPVGYAKTVYGSATVASRTMFWGGMILALFIVLHLLHFTFGTIHSEFVHGQVYANIHSAFSVWYVSVLYLIAMAFVGLHLYHGLWSVFQTLGMDNADRNAALRASATVVSLVIFLGFSVVPLAILSGALPAPHKIQTSVTH
jgi:succinate dehydrogenase / fumarate reductase cytochrome b subunit